MSNSMNGGTIVTIHDGRSSQVQVPLGDRIDWTPLREHLSDKLRVVRWNTILNVVIGFEEGNLSGRDVLVSWYTGCYTPDATRRSRTVNIFRKGNG